MEVPDSREIRVKVEASYHQKLQALKVLRNMTMARAIEEALDHYFAHVVPEKNAPGAPLPLPPSGPLADRVPPPQRASLDTSDTRDLS